MPEPVVVVGAALVRDGRLLAARRSAPADVAGRWELPGGKVDPGETEVAALVRECREELGVEVRPGERLGPESPLKEGYVLRVWLATLVDGEPAPLEDHDALRWLAPEELGEVDWLEADRPVVDVVRELLLDGSPLVGGRVGGVGDVVRVGWTVRRPTGPWTSAVHALLAHLRAAGVPAVPRPLGTDARGREVLSLLPGRPAAPSSYEPGLLADLGGWLRRVHDVSRTYGGPSRWRRGVVPLTGGRVVCHNDLNPTNVLVEDGRLSGVVDWDMAAPGRPVEDLAFAAWMWVLREPAYGVAEEARRVGTLAVAYGMPAARVLGAVEPRMRGAVRWIRRGAAEGDAGLQRLVTAGVPEEVEAGLAAYAERQESVLAALAA